METKKPVVPEPEEIPLDKNNPDSIYNWVAKKISGPSFRNIIKDFIDDNCSLFIDIEENTFQQGQIFNEFNQLLENILGDVLQEGGLTQEQFLEAAQRGLEDKTYKKYFDQLLNFSDYTFFKRIMTKRNYTLIKKFEEQIEQQKKEEEEKKLEEEKQKELEKEIEKEKEKGKEKEENGENKEEKKEKTERELEEERQRLLLLQMLNQEEEKELQEALKQSAAIEEEKRKREIIEEEEFNRAIKQSLLESNNPPPKPEEPKKVDYQIQKNDNILYYNQPKPIPKEEPKDITPQKKPLVFTTTSNNSFQYSGLINNEEKKETKPSNIITANKGYDFQIQSNNNNFGITSQNIQEINIEDNKDINKEKKIKKEFEIKDNIIDEKKEPEIEKVEIQRKKEENKDTKPIIDYSNNNKQNLKNNINNNLIEEDNEKNENNNIIVTDEIKTKNKPILEIPPPIEEQKPSDILKNNYQNETNQTNNVIHENYEQDDTNANGGYDRLLISDDEDDEEKQNTKNNNVNNNTETKPLSNAFIDKKNDYNLGKVQVGKDGGNFFNNFGGGIKNYQKGGMEQLESKLKKEQFQSVIAKPNEDDDFFAKLKEVEKEKNEKLKEYREQLTKMQKEKRENKAKQTLSKEELAKLQRRELLAQKLKAKMAQDNNK